MLKNFKKILTIKIKPVSFKQVLKRLWKLSLWGLLMLLLVIVLSNTIINVSTRKRIYTEIQDLPHTKAGLVPGTSKYLSNGNKNPYYTYRIEAAIKIFNAGKIDFIVVSGDNRRANYNEPKQMKNDLIKGGIPERKIYSDYAGFRTFDSVIRMYKIFGQKKFIVISQKFHNQRAVFIAKSHGIDVYGYCAKDVKKFRSKKTKIRELLARVKVFIDIITRQEPKFLGEKIEIK